MAGGTGSFGSTRALGARPDEVHKIPGWAERVKANWDRDT